MKPRALDKLLREEGWEPVRGAGGHRIYAKAGREDQIIISWHDHGNDVPSRILNRVKSQMKRGDLHLQAKRRTP